jgi:hypothetical protein
MKAGASLAHPRGERRGTPAVARSTVPAIPGFTPRSEDVYAHILRRVAPARLVLVAGSFSLLIYLALVARFPIFLYWSHPHAANDPTAINDMGRITGYSPFAAAGFVLAILTLFACQFLALTAVARVPQTSDAQSRADRLVLWAALGFPVLFALIMMWMQPVTTTDLYGYVARGYLYAHLHQNPMTTPATLLPGGLTVDRPAAPYGPLWLLIAGLISRFAGEDLLATMLAFKVIGVLGVITALWLVDRLALALYPSRRLRIDVLFAWSPLLLFESVGNGHNDIVMVVCVLAALALMLRGHSRTAFALLVVGALVKYVSAVFVPLWLAYELRHRLRSATLVPAQANGAVPAALAGPAGPVSGWTRAAMRTLRELDHRAAAFLLAEVTLIGGVLVVICYAPFWDGLSTFTGLGQQLRPLYYNSSIVGFFTAPLQLLVSPAAYKPLDKTVRLVVYVIFGLYAYLQTQRLWMLGPSATVREVATAAAKITFAALILITFWFQPWYVVWLLPLAALSREPYVRRQGTILAAGALMTYAVGNFLLVDEPGLGRDLFVQFFEILVAFAPLLFLRAAPYDQGWRSIVRRYAGLLGGALDAWPDFWQRLMLALVLIVAAILRLVELGSLFSQLPSGSSEVAVLKEASGDLRLGLSDPQGLHGLFSAVQTALMSVFGRTPFAVLLPSAVIGTLTVVLIYLVTRELLVQSQRPGKHAIPLLAALLAATSRWHVSLSRSGMEVVVLPMLLLLAVYWLLLALRRSHAALRTEGSRAKTPAGRRRRRGQRASRASAGAPSRGAVSPSSRRLLLYAGVGLATGLACDVAPGLWLVPLVVIGVCLLWLRRMPARSGLTRGGLAVLSLGALTSGLPVVWHYASRVVGFPAGSLLLARSSVGISPGPGVLSGDFWLQVGRNAADVVRLLGSQDYSAGYPAVGGTPIVPTLLGPFYVVGLIAIVLRWRSFASQALLLLLALPLVASVAVGTPTGVIEASSVLPAMCIIPAVGLYEVVQWFGHLPIVLDRINGVRVFSTPEQIGRVLLLVFLLVSAIRTFFWYFEATLPSQPPNQFIPTYAGPRVAQVTSGPAGVAYVVVPRTQT